MQQSERKKLRTNIIRKLFWVAVILIVVKLFDIQVLNHQYYVDEASERQTMQRTIVAERGQIYMMDGENEPVVAVMNTKVWTVVLDPQISRLDRENIEKKITEHAKNYLIADWNDVFASMVLRYYIVARNVPYEVAEKIRDEELDGVWLQATTKRVYPEGGLGAGVLGFVNADGIGQYGVEGALNEELTGKNGVLKTVKDVNNIPLTIGNQNVKVPAENGKNIVLTIDRNIQNATEKALREVTKELDLANATAIVMNPQTGEILAMAGLPTYDPADYGNVESANVYQVDATTGLYEPASVCKTFAFAAAVNEGKITPETTFYNSDRIVVDGWPITNTTPGHTGNITMQEAYSWSLNTGSTHVLEMLAGDGTSITYQGKEILYDYYYNRFHLGKLTGIELMESTGIIWEPSNYELATDARYANMTFGHGISLTALQVLAAFSTVINGGDYYKPTLVAGEVKDGEFLHLDISEPESDKISREASKTMRQMLHGARGIFRNAPEWDKGAYIGGKTGTAQTVDEETGAYVAVGEGQTIGSYVGFGAKSEDDLPEYAIVTKIWEKGKAADGATHAKPIFDRISKFMISYLHWDVQE